MTSVLLDVRDPLNPFIATNAGQFEIHAIQMARSSWKTLFSLMTTKSEPISLLFSFCKLQNFNDTKYYLFNMHLFHLHPVPS